MLDVRVLMPYLLLVLTLPLLAACSQGNYHAKSLDGLMPELAFELTSEEGEPVTAADYTGRINLMYFGFTHCRMECPTAMAHLRQVLDRLEPEVRDQVQVLFVGVDIPRDTPASLRQFTDNFGERFIGLTGNEEQLRALAKRYRTTFGYGEPDESGHYMVSHSNAIFAFDRQGEPRLLIKPDQSAERIAEDLRRLARS